MALPIVIASPLSSVTLYPQVLWLLKSSITMCGIFLWPSSWSVNCPVGGLYTDLTVLTVSDRHRMVCDLMCWKN